MASSGALRSVSVSRPASFISRSSEKKMRSRARCPALVQPAVGVESEPARHALRLLLRRGDRARRSRNDEVLPRLQRHVEQRVAVERPRFGSVGHRRVVLVEEGVGADVGERRRGGAPRVDLVRADRSSARPRPPSPPRPSARRNGRRAAYRRPRGRPHHPCPHRRRPPSHRWRGRSSRAPPSRDPTRHPSWRGAASAPCGTCATQTLTMKGVRLEIVERHQRCRRRPRPPRRRRRARDHDRAPPEPRRSSRANCRTTRRPTPEVAPRVTQLDEPRAAEARREHARAEMSEYACPGTSAAACPCRAPSSTPTGLEQQTTKRRGPSLAASRTSPPRAPPLLVEGGRLSCDPSAPRSTRHSPAQSTTHAVWRRPSRISSTQARGPRRAREAGTPPRAWAARREVIDADGVHGAILADRHLVRAVLARAADGDAAVRRVRPHRDSYSFSIRCGNAEKRAST